MSTPCCSSRVCTECAKNWYSTSKLCPVCAKSEDKITDDDMIDEIERLMRTGDSDKQYLAQMKIIGLLIEQFKKSTAKELKISIKNEAIKRIESLKGANRYNPQLKEFENFFKNAKIDGGLKKRSKSKSRKRRRKSKSKSKKRRRRRSKSKSRKRNF